MTETRDPQHEILDAEVRRQRESQARLHKIPAVQERIGVGRSKVFELMEAGLLRSVKIGKSRLVPESAIVEFIERLEREQCPQDAA